MDEKISISAVVPIYNEEKTVGLVLDTLISSNLFSQIICINDGSTDKSLEVLRRYSDKVTIIDLEKNMGKGYALAEGVSRSKSDLVLFLDADFLNLEKIHLEKLIKPILYQETDVVVGLTSDSFLYKKTFSYLSGQRVFFKKDLVPLLPRMKLSRYGVEILLNEAFKNKKIVKVLLKDLGHLTKTKKHHSLKAMRRYLT